MARIHRDGEGKGREDESVPLLPSLAALTLNDAPPTAADAEMGDEEGWKLMCESSSYEFDGTGAYRGTWRAQYELFNSIKNDPRPLNAHWATRFRTKDARNEFWLHQLRRLGNQRVTSVNEYAFQDCTLLKIECLPEHIVEVGASAFDGCENLKVDVGHLKTIGKDAFRGCRIDSEDYWRSLCTTRGFLFYGDLPDAPKGAYVGVRCVNPTDKWRRQYETFVSVQNDMHGSTIHGLGVDTPVRVAPEFRKQRNDAWIARMRSPNLGAVTSPVNVHGADLVTSLTGGEFGGAFADCMHLRLTHLPDDIVEIGDMAFELCVQLNLDKLPDKLRFVGSRSFASCNALQLAPTLTNPAPLANILSIGKAAFEECGSLVVDSELNKNLAEIPSETFCNCVALKIPTLPHRLVRIGEMAFANCRALEIEVEQLILRFLATVEYKAFSRCANLCPREIYAPALETLGECAFMSCSSLVLPGGLRCDKLKTLMPHCFAWCAKLALPQLPSQLQTISNSAFQQCTALALKALPERLVTIGDAAFLGCSSLEIDEFPGTLSEVHPSAFEECPEKVQALAQTWLGEQRLAPESSSISQASTEGSPMSDSE